VPADSRRDPLKSVCFVHCLNITYLGSRNDPAVQHSAESPKSSTAPKKCDRRRDVDRVATNTYGEHSAVTSNISHLLHPQRHLRSISRAHTHHHGCPKPGAAASTTPAPTTDPPPPPTLTPPTTSTSTAEANTTTSTSASEHPPIPPPYTPPTLTPLHPPIPLPRLHRPLQLHTPILGSPAHRPPNHPRQLQQFIPLRDAHGERCRRDRRDMGPRVGEVWWKQ
jgi:hypothetical protein